MVVAAQCTLRPTWRDRREQAIHLLVLFNLAFAARWYCLFDEESTFFLVRNARAIDVIVIVLALSLVLPAMLAGTCLVAGRIGPRTGQAVYRIMVFLLLAAIALPICKQTGWLSSRAVVAAGFALGAGATAVYVASRWARLLVTILWPVVLICPGQFLFCSPCSTFLFWAAQPPMLDVRIGRPAPVVVVVFDEFCGMSLMDDRGRIDAIRYPNFAALAKDAHWFRNATTMSPSTDFAVPSLLSGEYPKDRRRPALVCQYPRNLFTLLGKTYEITAREVETRLCPGGLSQPQSIADRGTMARVWSLLADTAVLELQILLPPDWPLALPDLTASPGGILLGSDDVIERWQAPRERQAEAFSEFISTIRAADAPQLDFIHVMLPHVPWTYLPSGKEYQLPLPADKVGNVNVSAHILGLERQTQQWPPDEHAVIQAHQRYLLQLGFTDQMLGRLLARLKEVGLYDACLLVVTADHGLSFRAGDNRHFLTETNYADLMSIPLFIKTPCQRKGTVSDRNVQSPDILPTIADVLEIELPRSFDGESAFGPPQTERLAKEVTVAEGAAERRRFDRTLPEREDTLRLMLARFGCGGKQDRLFAAGPHPELIGRPVEDLPVGAAADCRGELVDADHFSNVDPTGHWLPCYVGGRLVVGADAQGPSDLAIAVNGTIWAVTRTFTAPGLEDVWAAMLPEAALRPGRNDVQVFVVRLSESDLTLYPVPGASTEGIADPPDTGRAPVSSSKEGG